MTTLTKRPILLSIVCIVGYVWVFINFPGIFSPFLKKQGDWMPAIFGLIVAAEFIGYVGVWHLKKWGVNLYIVASFSKYVFSLATDSVNYVGLSFSILFITLFLFFYKRLDNEL